MSRQKFLYVSYIKTTVEQLWNALTSSEFTRQYWQGNEVFSDWKVGSPVTMNKRTGVLALNGKVLVSEKPKHL